MKIRISVLMISVLLILSACGGPEESPQTAPADTALISSEETTVTVKKETTTTKVSQPESSPAERPEAVKLPSGLRAVSGQAGGENTEPSGEDFKVPSENAGSQNVQASNVPAWSAGTDQDRTEPPKPQENITPAATKETSCPHGEVCVAGAIAATCIREGYSGDVICALCGQVISEGYSTGFGEHSWEGRQIHEDAYLTCYCGAVFYSAMEHDSHVNQMVAAGDPPDSHGCVWTPAKDHTVYTCSVCGTQLNN